MTEQQGELGDPGLRRRDSRAGAPARAAAPLRRDHPVRGRGSRVLGRGSARLLGVLGVTSPTTADNAPGRQRLAGAYCDALEGREPGDDGPGS